MPAAISISNLVKNYGAKPALRNCSLTVEEGEIYGFLGPNGAGKTTTIRCIMDYIRPNSGQIKILGLDAQKNSVETKANIGYLPADSQLYDKWSAQDHIDFCNQFRHPAADASKLLSRLDLDPHQQVRHLSTGNRQKLGLILALLGSPKLLILDEPTQGLDPLLQQEIYAVLKEYVADGGTVFLSSHNLSEVERICTKVGVIREGQIVADKSMSDIRAMKIHLVTVTFAQPETVAKLKIAGAEIVSSSDTQAVIKVHGDLNKLVAELAKHPLRDLEIVHAPLEEIFMNYYRSQP